MTPENPKTILVIDDEVDFCSILKSYLGKKGYEVHISHTLADGLKTLDEVNPDIVFLDNNLPDGFGWKVADLIIEQHPNIELNLISAYTSAQKTDEVRAAKIWEKPLNFSELQRYFPTR